MECTALRIVKEKGKLAGVLAYWRETGRFVLFECNAVILATGGGGKAWRITSNSWEYTGDGLELAYEAGAELLNMEFTQFHPTGMVWPPSVRGILVTEGVRGDGGILLNSEGERFMFNYIPERFASETADTEEEAERWLGGDKEARRPPELLTRDVVARAITKEVQEGRGSPHGGVFLDIASRRPAEVIRKKLPSMYHQFKELAEVDITAEPMEVGPTLHYFMGGIRVDSTTQMTGVPGLFACGECSGGMHGANRLGGNSLSDLLVFGMLAGEGAADYLDGLEGVPEASAETLDGAIREATAPLNREDGPNPYLVHEDLQAIMNDGVNIVRDKEGLEKSIQAIEDLKLQVALVKAHGSSQYNPGWHEAISLVPLLVTAESVARSALVREESRGAHTRADFPGEQEDWQTRLVVISKSEDGSMAVRQESTQEPPSELSKIAHSSLEDLEGGVK
jgi:succinate dehydrogenase / fumarate reductase flavoprotein subunit